MTVINDLPPEILEHIISFVSAYDDLKACRQVCRKWYNSSIMIAHKKRADLDKALHSGMLSLETPLIPSSEAIITHRFAHSAVIKDSSMYVFGGCAASHTTYNDLWRFDLATEKWCRVLAAGNYPSPKGYASLVSWKNKLFLLGGWSRPSSFSIFQAFSLHDEFHAFDLERNMWVEILKHFGPPALAGHGATIHKDHMVVFGGLLCQYVSSASSYVYCFDMVSENWIPVTVVGPSPPPRYSHSQIAIDENHLLVMGGFESTRKALKDIWILDMTKKNSWEWTQVTVCGQDNQVPEVSFSPSVRVGNKIVTFCKFLANPIGALHALQDSTKCMGHTHQLRTGEVKTSSPQHGLISKSPSELANNFKPSVRPNASNDKEKRMLMLARAEQRIKQTLDNRKKMLNDSQTHTQFAVHTFDISELVNRKCVKFSKCEKNGPLESMNKLYSPYFLHTILLGRGHLIIFGGLVYPNNINNEKIYSVSNSLLYVTPNRT